MNVLLVRLGALGDIVHAIPAAAAIRRALPNARIDWLVETRHRALLDLVTVIDHVVAFDDQRAAGWIEVVRTLRQGGYDIALDLQGLMKSAVLARASGAARVAGFSIWHLREKGARPFYSETDAAEQPDKARSDREPRDDERPEDDHVIHKNLRLLRVLDIVDAAIEFPLATPASAALDQVAGAGGFALLNPGAGWPNKRWPADRFGEVAAFLREVRGLSSVVLWGPGEEALAQAVVGASSGAARMAPPTGVADLVALSRAATLMISGDTGPLHIAAAVGTPVVAIFGPTNPRRNGPWSPDDEVVSRFEQCGCAYARRCQRDAWCLDGIPVAEVTAAIQHRLGAAVRGRLG